MNGLISRKPGENLVPFCNLHSRGRLRLYAGSGFSQENPKNINPIVAYAVEQSVGEQNSRAILVQDPKHADFFVLPMIWSFYLWRKRTSETAEFARDAAALGKQVLIWHGGDLEPFLPFQNAALFLSAPDQKSKLRDQFAAPRF